MSTSLFRQILLAISLGTSITQVCSAPLRITVTTYSEGTGKYFDEIAAAFESLHPEADIQIDEVPWNITRGKLNADLQAGQPPDLAIITTLWMGSFLQKNAITPLDDYLDEAFCL